MKKLLLITLSLATAIAARAADVPEKADLVSMTESSLISFGKAVKKKDFYGFYDDIAIVWQKQTTAEKLEELFKDFLDKGIDLPAAKIGRASCRERV